MTSSVKMRNDQFSRPQVQSGPKPSHESFSLSLIAAAHLTGYDRGSDARLSHLAGASNDALDAVLRTELLGLGPV